MDSRIREAFAWIEEWFRHNNEGGGRHHCPWCYYSHDDGIHVDGADWKDIEHDPECVIGKALALLTAEPEPHFDSEQKQGTYDSPIDQDGSPRWVDHVICEGSREPGKYLSKEQVWSLNEKYGWFHFGDAQGDVSRGFANDAVSLYLASQVGRPEPCEDAKVASENLALDLSISGMTIKTIQRHMTAYASQVADKRAEELRKLREALEPFADADCEDEGYSDEDNPQLLSCEEYGKPRAEWCAVCNAKEALAATEPKR